jgi:hypothetical protein
LPNPSSQTPLRHQGTASGRFRRQWAWVPNSPSQTPCRSLLASVTVVAKLYLARHRSGPRPTADSYLAFSTRRMRPAKYFP